MSKTIRVANGDWYIDPRGRSVWVENREKVSQDLACFLLQILYDDGSRGSELANIENSAILDAENAHKALIQTLVSEAVERLLVFQEQEEDIPDLEKIDEYSVYVERLSGQTLSYAYYLTVKTVGSDEPVTDTFVVELEQTRDPNILNANPFGNL
jgi:hypothetical protein